MLSLDFLDFIFSFLHAALGTLAACSSLTSQGPHQPRAFHLCFVVFSSWKSLPDMLMTSFLVPFNCQQRGLPWPPIYKCTCHFPPAYPCLPTPTYVFAYSLPPFSLTWELPGQKACSLHLGILRAWHESILTAPLLTEQSKFIPTASSQTCDLLTEAGGIGHCLSPSPGSSAKLNVLWTGISNSL